MLVNCRDEVTLYDQFSKSPGPNYSNILIFINIYLWICVPTFSNLNIHQSEQALLNDNVTHFL